ncbi:hypothetical protein KR067_003165 [Drosophila pandora]|nr:hypothetical protein KR067_003165 [Drosophila pandora]
METGIFRFIFLLLVKDIIVNGARLNHPRVLLPIFQGKAVNFTLEVDEQNCYKWTSSRQDLISVMPVYHGFSECAYQAVVTVRTNDRRRNTAIVFAEEEQTGETLRCDVIVDVIASLNVRTATRQLYLEEAPAMFELHAFDEQGNEFFTLEGIEFVWEISEPGGNKPAAMRHLTFTDSPYHTVPPALESFEAKGIMGYMILLEGINTGTSKVTISMPQTDYIHVPPIEVYISVLANIIIEPSEVTILAGDSITFRIMQLKMDRLYDITDSQQYYLEIEDANVAYMRGSSATGGALGRTQVILRDRNMADFDKATKGPTALLTVAEPNRLGISLLPHLNWITVQGERHTVALDLFTADGQQITLGTSYSIGSELDESIFTVRQRTRNGSRLLGDATREGVSQVYGSYKDLSVQAELQIYESLKLTPSVVVLPYDPSSIKPLKLQFHASGGDYNYAWFSGNPQVLQIDAQGLATAEIRDVRPSFLTQEMFEAGSKLTAQTTVKVTLAKNQKIARLAQIHFLPPKRLEIKKYNFETAIEDYIFLHVAMYTRVNHSDVPYTNCDNLHFQLVFSHPILQHENNGEAVDPASDVCHVLRLRATSVGSTSLRVSYFFQDKELYDTVDLYVFEKLSVLNPVENELVLPVGSSHNVLFTHGPEHIFTLEAKLTKTTVFDKNVIKVAEVEETQNFVTAFTVLCHKLGEAEFIYRVQNTLMKPSFVAYTSQLTTKVRCVRPRFLKLLARQQLLESCPLEHRSSFLYLKDHGNKFEIEIEVQDAKNRRLMNISSLLIDWEFAAGDEKYQRDGIEHTEISELNSLHGVILPSRDILVLTIGEIASNFRVKGTVAHYKDKLLSHLEITAERPPFGVKDSKTGLTSTPVIENEVRFHTINRTLLSKDFVSIFLAKDYNERIPIAQGSGHFHLELSEQGIVKANYDTQSRLLILTPLHLGHVRLELTDNCLSNEASHLSISVVGIGAIKVISMDRVERSARIEAIVRLYDTNDNLLLIDHSRLSMYDLSELVMDPSVLSVRLGDQDNLGTGEIRYFIHGNNVGDTKVVFQSGNGDQTVLSEPLNVQVFSPIRLYPRDFTLVVGSSIQISYQGGPQPNSNVIYFIEKENVATMSSTSVTALRLGSSQITGKCIQRNPVTGKDEVISEDTVSLHVVSLKAIQIRVPLVHIRIGAVMPATIWGIPDLSPMVLGTLQGMQISWSVNQREVVEIFNVFSEAGIEYKNEDLISVRIRALNSGRVTVTASVSLADGTKLPPARVEVIVFKRLELVAPKPIKIDSILAAPRSTLQLKANMDDVVYKLAGQSNNIVSISPNGLLHTKDTLGRDLIIAKTVDQTLPIDIEVKNVEYILVSLIPAIKLKTIDHKVPRGMNFIFKVSLHDNLGTEFSETIGDGNELYYELATTDMVDVQINNNFSIALNLYRETNNVITIGLRDSAGVKHAEDYIKLAVVESKSIYPTKTIFSVGDVICFSSPLMLSSIWSSSNEQIVTINKHSGVARVLQYRQSAGEKIIITTGDAASRGGFIKYDLEIRESDVILFAKSLDIFSGSEYVGRLVLRNHVQADKYSNLIALNMSKCATQLESTPVDIFTCRLGAKDALGRQLLKFYKVEAWFDSTSGQYSCRLVLVSSFVELLALVKTKDVFLELEAATSGGIVDTMSLKLVPGIKVSPESIRIADLKSQEMHISGLDKALHKVQVKPSDPKFFSIDLIEHGHGVSKFRLKFFDDFPLDEHFYALVISPETEQRIEVPIVSSTMIQKCSGSSYGGPVIYRLLENLGFVLTTTVIVIISIWVYMSCFQTQGVTQVNSEGNTHPVVLFVLTPIFVADASSSHNYSQERRRNFSDSPNDTYVYGHPRLNSPNRSGSSQRFN